MQANRRVSVQPAGSKLVYLTPKIINVEMTIVKDNVVEQGSIIGCGNTKNGVTGASRSVETIVRRREGLPGRDACNIPIPFPLSNWKKTLIFWPCAPLRP